MLGYIQDCPCTKIIYFIVIIYTISQVFCYIPYPTSSYEATSERTSLYFKRVKLNITTDKMKSDVHTDSASTSRYDIEDNSDHVKLCTDEDHSDHVKLCTDIIFGIIDYSVIWCFKL